jgi:hypothetical protein
MERTENKLYTLGAVAQSMTMQPTLHGIVKKAENASNTYGQRLLFTCFFALFCDKSIWATGPLALTPSSFLLRHSLLPLTPKPEGV